MPQRHIPGITYEVQYSATTGPHAGKWFTFVLSFDTQKLAAQYAEDPRHGALATRVVKVTSEVLEVFTNG